MSKAIPFLLLFNLAFIISNCMIPEAKETTNDYFVIASDFLKAKDSLLFENFEKQSNIKIIIKCMSADSIQSHYEFYGYNSKIDGVILSTSYEMNELSKANVLHKLPKEYSTIPVSFRSPKNDWISFGLDPYVLDFGDSSVKKSSYNELTYGTKWIPVLSKEESGAFYASVVHQFGRKGLHKSKKWLQAMYDHSQSSISDTLKHSEMTLNRFSKAKNSHHNYLIPNQQKGGAFYDCVGIGIIQQSPNFVQVNQLISYLLKPHNNQIILGKLSLFPIENPKNRSDFKYQNAYPRLFRCTPNKCVREYRDVERILRKIDHL